MAGLLGLEKSRNRLSVKELGGDFRRAVFKVRQRIQDLELFVF